MEGLKILEAKYEGELEFPGGGGEGEGEGEQNKKNLLWESMDIFWNFTLQVS